MIARLYAGHACADLANDACAFVAENGGEDAFAIETVERVSVRVADAGGLDFDKHFARLRPFQVNLNDFERLLSLKSDGCACFQVNLLLVTSPTSFLISLR